MAHRCRRVGAVHHIIRVAPTDSKASPNVRYAFNSDRICASQQTDARSGSAISHNTSVFNNQTTIETTLANSAKIDPNVVK
jgi:hypothetical protein